jgi:hypothetical protein
MEPGLQGVLWSFEGPGSETSAAFAWLQNNLPVPVDYVIVVSNEQEELEHNPDYARVQNVLEKNMRRVARPLASYFLVNRSKPFFASSVMRDSAFASIPASIAFSKLRESL